MVRREETRPTDQYYGIKLEVEMRVVTLMILASASLASFISSMTNMVPPKLSVTVGAVGGGRRTVYFTITWAAPT